MTIASLVEMVSRLCSVLLVQTRASQFKSRQHIQTKLFAMHRFASVTAATPPNCWKLNGCFLHPLTNNCCLAATGLSKSSSFNHQSMQVSSVDALTVDFHRMEAIKRRMNSLARQCLAKRERTFQSMDSPCAILQPSHHRLRPCVAATGVVILQHWISLRPQITFLTTGTAEQPFDLLKLSCHCRAHRTIETLQVAINDATIIDATGLTHELEWKGCLQLGHDALRVVVFQIRCLSGGCFFQWLFLETAVVVIQCDWFEHDQKRLVEDKWRAVRGDTSSWS